MQERDFSYWEKCSGGVQNKLQVQPSAVLLPTKPVDVLIVGAGFCGSWLAYFLKRKNPKLQIAIVERDFLSLGASTRNAGFLSFGNISEWAEDLDFLGWDNGMRTLLARLEGIDTIVSEFGKQIAIQHFGSVDCDELTEEKKTLMHRLNEFLISQKFQPFFEERNVDFGGSKRVAAFNSFDMQVNPCELLLKLHESLKKSGVQFVWETTVDSIGNGEAIVSKVDREDSIKYKHAYICTNAFARDLNPASQVAPARGQIIVTAPCRTKTTRSLGFLRSGYDYYRFIDDRLLVGGGRLSFKANEDTDRMEPTDELRKYLIELAGKVIGNNDFVVEHHWSGIMGMRRGQHASFEDMHKQVKLDAVTEEVAGCGGWGVTLTPYIAKNRAAAFFI